METTILNPQVVYTQATTPSDLTKGKIWYNTTNNSIYTSNGSSYVLLKTDLSQIQKQQLEQDLNILINSVASSSTLNDWEDMFVDEFTDADGTSDTIDTENTTAIFSTNKYINQFYNSNQAHGETQTNAAGFVGKGGLRIEATANFKLTKVSKVSTSDATHAYIHAYTDGSALGDLLASAVFSGNDATFTYDLTNGVKYYIVIDKEANTCAHKRSSGTTFPIAKGFLTFDAGVEGQGGFSESSTMVMSVESISGTTIPANLIIQTNAITCDTAQTHHQVFAHNTLAGSGAITYDISFDNGSSWDTDQTLNTKNARVSTTGTQMILKLNLNGVGAGNTASADDYGIMLFY